MTSFPDIYLHWKNMQSSLILIWRGINTIDVPRAEVNPFNLVGENESRSKKWPWDVDISIGCKWWCSKGGSESYASLERKWIRTQEIIWIPGINSWSSWNSTTWSERGNSKQFIILTRIYSTVTRGSCN